MSAYVGRFAPSPTGALHAGSLVAALASWLDARAHGGRWLLRIEDVDTPRCVPGADDWIVRQLARCALVSDGPVLRQSTRGAAYAEALARLIAQGHGYGCACSRQDIERVWAARGVPHQRHGERVYPGTCRPAAGGLRGRTPRATRLLSCDDRGHDITLGWHDRRLGAQRQNVTREVGDFVLHRADGLWAYQLAVVVDDAGQGITAVVRGEDLADNTARQILLQQRLGLPTPSYLHTPLVLAADGQKLSKQNGARALDLDSDAQALAALREAARVLGLPEALAPSARHAAEWLPAATAAWRGLLATGIIAPCSPLQPQLQDPAPCPPPPVASSTKTPPPAPAPPPAQASA